MIDDILEYRLNWQAACHYCHLFKSVYDVVMHLVRWRENSGSLQRHRRLDDYQCSTYCLSDIVEKHDR